MDLIGWAKSHRKPLLIAGAGGVAVFALARRGGGGGGLFPANSSGGRLNVAPGASGTYDSTASDVYNSVQPQLNQIFDWMSRLQQGTPALTTDPVGTPTKLPTGPGVWQGGKWFPGTKAQGHKVGSGETLMSIARKALGPRASAATVSGYANRIKGANRFVPKSGQLKPGQIVLLPNHYNY